jgi:hypothetical protein
MDAGGPIPALMNTNVGWLAYPRRDHGDPDHSSRNPMYDKSDAALGGLAFDGLYEREHLSSSIGSAMGRRSWALPKLDIMRVLEYLEYLSRMRVVDRHLYLARCWKEIRSEGTAL